MVRIDGDVIAWLRDEGEGYESRINDVLRTWMDTARASRK